MTTPEDIARISECLTYTQQNKPKTLGQIRWWREVENEARAAGLLPQLADRIGCNCKEPYFEPVYGGDMVDAF